MKFIHGCSTVVAATVACLILAMTGTSMAASTVTIVATVTDGYQLVDDNGQPYEIEDTERGNELVLNHIGHKVEVTGTVKDEVDYKIIVVDSYRVLEE
jgi:predicted lipoprotein with Yx(FWY)xxD motif